MLVLIVGGGPAGVATSLSLAHSAQVPTKTLFIDNGDPARFRVGESLPPEALKILKFLCGPSSLVCRSLGQDHSPSVGKISLWGSTSPETVDSIINPFGAGWHLDRALFQKQLLGECKSRTSPGSREFLAATLVDLVPRPCDGGWVAQLRTVPDGNLVSVECGWIVDATGRLAAVSKKAGAKSFASDHLVALYTIFSVDGARDQDGRTVVEAVPHGWFYTALLPRHRRLFVFHTDPKSPSSQQAATAEGFVRLLEETSTLVRSFLPGKHLGGPLFPPRRTAANSTRLSSSVSLQHRWAAVGDAVLAFDPLSSQGMMTALECGFLLGRALAHSAAKTEEGRQQLLRNLVAYEAHLAEIHSRYVEGLKAHYSRENRFPASPFWASRHQGQATSPSHL